jgi:hypothetical protein
VQDTRISRGDGGSVFVLVKDVSFSVPADLPPTTTAIVPVEDAAIVAAPAPYLSVGLLTCALSIIVVAFQLLEQYCQRFRSMIFLSASLKAWAQCGLGCSLLCAQDSGSSG